MKNEQFEWEEIFKAVVAKDGNLSQSTFDEFKAMGVDIFNDKELKNMVTTATIFSADTTLYVGAQPVDYTGMPFVGKYTFEGSSKIEMELTADGRSNMAGSYFPYTATADGDNYVITYGEYAFTFTTSTGVVSNAEIGTYHLVDSAACAIVTLTSDNPEHEWQIGEYAIAKGQPFNLILDKGRFKLNLTGYTDGTLISSDVTYAIESVIQSKTHLRTDTEYGTYLNGYFVFDNNNTVSYNKGTATTISVTYSIMDLTVDTITVKITLSGADITAIFTQDGFTVADGTYAGTYILHTLYIGMPFVGEYTNETEKTYYRIEQSGNAYDGNNNHGTLKLTGIANDIYTFDFTYYNDKEPMTAIVTVNIATKVLTFNGVEYIGAAYMGEPFIGEFAFEGDIVTIDKHGYISTGAKITGTNTNNGVITITCDNGTLSYDIATDALTVDGKVYTRAIRIQADLSYDYINRSFTGENGGDIRINEYGFVFLNGTYIGQSANLTDNGFDFTPKGSTQITISFTVAEGKLSFTYGNVTYSHSMPKVYGQPFVNREYTSDKILVRFNEYDNIIYFDGTQELQGTVTALAVDEAGTVTIDVTYYDKTETGMTETHATWVYDTAANTFTLNGTVFTTQK